MINIRFNSLNLMLERQAVRAHLAHRLQVREVPREHQEDLHLRVREVLLERREDLDHLRPSTLPLPLHPT